MEVPLTARSDIMQLYAQSPFHKTEIVFPPAEISTRYVLRLWVDREQRADAVRAALQQYLQTYYANSDTRLVMMLNAEALALSNLNAEQRAKQYELDYLLKNYLQLRQQRIALLQEEVEVLGAAIVRKQRTLLSAPRDNIVVIQAFEPTSPRNLARAILVRSLLVALAIALLQLIWLQQRTESHAPR